jgi:protein-S-isoprenylcysteine O-methyltransferase Ste14
MSDILTRLEPGPAIAGLWIAFVLSWAVAAFWANRAEKRVGLTAEAPYRLLLIVGTLLFVVPAHGYQGWMRLWQVNLVEAWICVVLIAVGIAFAWWARIHLGRLWSARITRKAGHYIVDTGPYGVTRHPIYTGILLAILATMVAKGTLAGIAGAVLIAASFYVKARQEERFLREELGAEAYDGYSRRVPMLIPFA